MFGNMRFAGPFNEVGDLLVHVSQQFPVVPEELSNGVEQFPGREILCGSGGFGLDHA